MRFSVVTSRVLAWQVVQRLYPDLAIRVRNPFGDVVPGSLPLPADGEIRKACAYEPTLADLPFASSDRPTAYKTHPLSSFRFKVQSTPSAITCPKARGAGGRREGGVGAAESVCVGEGRSGRVQPAALRPVRVQLLIEALSLACIRLPLSAARLERDRRVREPTRAHQIHRRNEIHPRLQRLDEIRRPQVRIHDLLSSKRILLAVALERDAGRSDRQSHLVEVPMEEERRHGTEMERWIDGRSLRRCRHERVEADRLHLQQESDGRRQLLCD